MHSPLSTEAYFEYREATCFARRPSHLYVSTPKTPVMSSGRATHRERELINFEITTQHEHHIYFSTARIRLFRCALELHIRETQTIGRIERVWLAQHRIGASLHARCTIFESKTETI